MIENVQMKRYKLTDNIFKRVMSIHIVLKQNAKHNTENVCEQNKLANSKQDNVNIEIY